MKVLLLFSGGLDSTVCLAMALHDNCRVHAVTFGYGSRHEVAERTAARAVISYYAQRGEPVTHEERDLPRSLFAGSALTDGNPVARADGVPATYVPARNLILLAVAAGIAEREGAERVFYGAHGGSVYPDCQPPFADAFGEAMRLGTRTHIRLVAPVIYMPKAQIVGMAHALRAPVHLTRSCYAQDSGVACGVCDACKARLAGFRDAGYRDALAYAAWPAWVAGLPEWPHG